VLRQQVTHETFLFTPKAKFSAEDLTGKTTEKTLRRVKGKAINGPPILGISEVGNAQHGCFSSPLQRGWEANLRHAVFSSVNIKEDFLTEQTTKENVSVSNIKTKI
jgi:hypothetical protein